MLTLLSISHLHAQVADTDGDGMPDFWETSMGLDTANPEDALSDADGDRIPNLWEYARGTAANNATSVPAYDAMVNSRLNIDGSQNTATEFATLQQAQIALATAATHDPAYRYLVFIKLGTYPFQLDGALQGDFNQTPLPPIKIAWIAEQPGNRTIGEERVILDDSLYGVEVLAHSIVLQQDTVMDGVFFDGGSSLYNNSLAVWTTPHPAEPTNSPRIRFINCIFANWTVWSLAHPNNLGQVTTAPILIEGSHVSFVNSTIWGSSGLVYGNPAAILETGVGGSAIIANSILWDSTQPVTTPFTGSNITVITSVIQAGALGGLNTDPQLNTYNGLLTSTSTVCLSGGTALWRPSRDIHGELRSGAVQLGADHWINTDADSLPDAWEAYWFNSQSINNTSVTNLDESALFHYLHGSPAVSDLDLDQLPDDVERQHFGFIELENALGDPDGDQYPNLLEYLTGTDPMDANSFDLDWDCDGIADLVEWGLFGGLNQDLLSDYDGDGLNNGAEWSNGFDPKLIDSDGDGIEDGTIYSLSFAGTVDPDGDSLAFAAELTKGTNPLLADTDGDGVNDPTRSTAGTGGSVTISLRTPPATSI
jgi:hypothetical protein